MLKVVPVLSFILLWELISNSGVVNDKLFPPPTQVLEALYQWGITGELWRDIKVSYWRMLLGFLVGGFLGTVTGMFTGLNKTFNLLFNPLIQMFRPLPPVAIIPLIIVWFGIGDVAKVISISFAVFFPVWINVHLGAKNIPKTYFWSANLLTKKKSKIFFKISLPAALPSIIAGWRTSIAIAFIMVYVSEIAGASEGIGYQISISHLAYQIDKMMAALIVLALAGASADLLFSYLIDKAFPWIKLGENG